MRLKTACNISLITVVAFLAGVAAAYGEPGKGNYQRDVDAAMATMHAKMMAPPSGDVDRDFVQMMIPHHQGAIDMAVAELQYGSNAQLKRLAQAIIVQQQQEITVMRLALGHAEPHSAPAPMRPPQYSDMSPHRDR